MFLSNQLHDAVITESIHTDLSWTVTLLYNMHGVVLLLENNPRQGVVKRGHRYQALSCEGAVTIATRVYGMYCIC